MIIFGLTELQILVAWEEKVCSIFMGCEATRFLYFQGVERRYVNPIFVPTRRSKFELHVVGVLHRSCTNRKYFELAPLNCTV